MINILQAIKEGLKNTFDLTKRVKILNPCSNVDAHYGPYTSLDEARTTLTGLLTSTAIGRTIGVIDGNKVTEYWLQPVLDDKGNLTTDDGGNTICDFVLKQCVDLDDVEVIRIPASAIDVLFDDDPDDPAINPDYLQEQTEGTKGEVPFDPETPIDPGTIGGTEE
jgi:hypothetical protein